MRKLVVFIFFTVLFFAQPVKAQLFNIADAPVLARLSEMLRIHRENLVQSIRTARGIENTFNTLQNLDDYERGLRRDVNFISSLDLRRLDDLERVILFGDRTEFYFRSLTGTINRQMYNANQLQRYSDGFVNSMDGLGLIDQNMLQALFNDEKTLAELGITPMQAEALISELGIESNLLGMYQVKGTEDLIKSLSEQGNQLKTMAGDSSLKMDQGQRVMLLAKSEESLIEALKYQQELAKQLQDRNKVMTRKLVLKSELENEISQLEQFYEWRISHERNLGFFDSDFVKRYRFR